MIENQKKEKKTFKDNFSHYTSFSLARLASICFVLFFCLKRYQLHLCNIYLGLFLTLKNYQYILDDTGHKLLCKRLRDLLLNLHLPITNALILYLIVCRYYSY